MTTELSFNTIIGAVYVISLLFVILHSFLINKESPIATRVVWIIATLILGPFGAAGYYLYGSGEYYELKKV